MSFRVKLVFNSKNDLISLQYRKILFPVNINECPTIKDLKLQIKSFLSKDLIHSSNYEVDLKIDGYLLPDVFETNNVIRENDEIDVYITEKSMIEKEVVMLKKKIERDEKIHTEKKKYVSLSSSESEEEPQIKEKSIKITPSKNHQVKNKVSEDKYNKVENKDFKSYFIPAKKSEIDLNHSQNFTSFDIEIEKDKKDKIGILKNTSKNNQTIYNANKNYEKKVNFQEPQKVRDKKYYSFKNIYDKDPEENEKISEISKHRIEYDLNEFKQIDNLKNNNDLLTQILTENSKILFKMYELIDSNPEISKNYRLGTVLDYSRDKSITIRLDKENEEFDYLLDTYSQNVENYENKIIILPINEILELHIEKSKLKLIENSNNKQEDPKDKMESLSNGIKENSNQNVKIENTSKNTNAENCIKEESKSGDKKPNPQKKNIFLNNVHHALKRQVEFYFSNKNYYTDPFIKQNLDSDNYISLDLIMGFNRVKTLTDNKDDIINALRDSNTVEFDESYTKLKKKI